MRPFRGSLRVLGLLLSLLLGAPTALSGAPQVNGKLDRIGPFRVLRVWGTPKEMGYAHGVLIGGEVVSEINAMFAAMPLERRKPADLLKISMRPAIRIPEPWMEEMKGMFEGIAAAAGSPPSLEALNRPLSLDDLVMHNAYDALRAFACSGFTVWGDRAGEANVITTRNFDFDLATPTMLDRQLIVVRQPKDRKQVALITWPGYLGAATGINDAGVCVFMHDGTGERLRMPQSRYTPVALALTEMLERTTPADAHAKFETALRGVVPYPFSYLIRVIAPRVPGSVETPERVFHVDASGLGENPAGSYQCITTNHYLEGNFKPDNDASEWSLERFQKLEQRVNGEITSRTAWDALLAVSRDGDGGGTLYSLVIYPERRTLELAFGRLENGRLVAAPKNQHVKIDFDELFAHGR